METAEQKSAGAILCMVNDGDIEILLLYQNNSRYNRESREPVVDIGPKGQLNENEDERQAALREIKEETGLTPKLDDKFREELDYSYDDISRETGRMTRISKKVVFFLAYITQDDIEKITLSQEHLGCKMVRIDEAIGGTRHRNQKRILGVVKRYIEDKKL